MPSALPNGLILRGEIFHINISRNGKRIRRTLGKGTTLAEAKAALAEMRAKNAELKRNKIQYAIPDPNGIPWEVSDTWIRSALFRARKRARERGFDFDLTEDGLRSVIAASSGRCQVTGIPFVAGQEKKFHAHPFMPSVDRINSMSGYVMGNVRLVCYCVNVAMSQWGEEVLEKIAKSYMLKLLQKDLGSVTSMAQWENEKSEESSQVVDCIGARGGI